MENMMCKSHKATNKASRDGYDRTFGRKGKKKPVRRKIKPVAALNLTFSEYQKRARETAIYPESPYYAALGLAGEVGEAINKLKKVIRGDYELSAIKLYEIGEELGGVLWYLSNMASDLALDLDEIAYMNLMQLTSRKERGVLRGDGDDR